jgi:hypothetical protein
MAFVNQTEGGRFVSFGKKKEENNFLVKKGESIEGKVVTLKNSNKYGKILELKVKGEEDNLIVVGSTILIRELGYRKIDDKKPTYESNITEREEVEFVVVEGDVIRITFNGMIKTGKGNDAYDLKVEKDM